MDLLEKLIPHTDTNQLHVGEIYEIWTQAMARYDTMGLTQYMIGLIHDKDFKVLVEMGLDNIIKPQIKKLEDIARKVNVPLPSKPPINVNMPYNSDGAEDEDIFKLIIDGAQAALGVHVKAICISTNDQLRDMFEDFLRQDLDNYNKLVKYGKMKGWLKNPPHYMQQRLAEAP